MEEIPTIVKILDYADITAHKYARKSLLQILQAWKELSWSDRDTIGWLKIVFYQVPQTNYYTE